VKLLGNRCGSIRSAKGDCRQTAIGNQFPLSLSVGLFGAGDGRHAGNPCLKAQCLPLVLGIVTVSLLIASRDEKCSSVSSAVSEQLPLCQRIAVKPPAIFFWKNLSFPFIATVVSNK